MTPDALKRFLNPLVRKIAMSITRIVVKDTKDAATGNQKAQVTGYAGETLDNLERIQEYGFTSRPKDGAEGVMLSINGDRSHSILIKIDDKRYRLKNLAKGEVAIYTDEGDYIHFKRSRNIEVLAGTKIKATAPNVEIIASTKVTMTTPECEISGNLTVGGNTDIGGDASVGGDCDVTGDASATNITGSATIAGATVTGGAGGVSDSGGSLSSLRSAYNSHTHSETGTITSGPTPTV